MREQEKDQSDTSCDVQYRWRDGRERLQKDMETVSTLGIHHISHISSSSNPKFVS